MVVLSMRNDDDEVASSSSGGPFSSSSSSSSFSSQTLNMNKTLNIRIEKIKERDLLPSSSKSFSPHKNSSFISEKRIERSDDFVYTDTHY